MIKLHLEELETTNSDIVKKSLTMGLTVEEELFIKSRIEIDYNTPSLLSDEDAGMFGYCIQNGAKIPDPVFKSSFFAVLSRCLHLIKKFSEFEQ